MAASSNTELTKEPTCHFPPGSNASLTANEETPDSFSLFHKLPIELRLKIWRYTFPRGRYVDLDDYNGFPIYSSFQTNGHLGKEPWLPIALSVNKESRQETLRHYIIVFLEDPVPRRICYNPSPMLHSWKKSHRGKAEPLARISSSNTKLLAYIPQPKY